MAGESAGIPSPIAIGSERELVRAGGPGSRGNATGVHKMVLVVVAVVDAVAVESAEGVGELFIDERTRGTETNLAADRQEIVRQRTLDCQCFGVGQELFVT